MTEVMENVATRRAPKSFSRRPSSRSTGFPSSPTSSSASSPPAPSASANTAPFPARSSSTSSRPATPGTCSSRYEDSIAGIYYARAWDAQVLVGLDRRFVFSLIDAAYGGDGSTQPFETDRPFTPLEIRLARSVFDIVIAGLRRADAADFAGDFRSREGRIQARFPDPRPERNSRRRGADTLSGSRQRRAHVHDHSPIRACIRSESGSSAAAHSKSTTVDPEWARKMQDGLVSANVILEGVLDGPSLTLDEISELREGQIIRLESDPQSLDRRRMRGRERFLVQPRPVQGSLRAGRRLRRRPPEGIRLRSDCWLATPTR